MKAFAATLALGVLLLTGCVSVRVSPATIAALPGREADRANALQRWREAIAIANGFLASDFNQTLPHGRLALENDRMSFSWDGRSIPLKVRCTTAGDLLTPFHMVAQERSDGFVVASLRPRRDREIDNSMFRLPDGSPTSNAQIAGLILHELTHCYFQAGTVSFPKTVRYYAEAIFLLRYRTHSMEARAYQTTAEFDRFVRDLIARQQKGAAPAEAAGSATEPRAD